MLEIDQNSVEGYNLGLHIPKRRADFLDGKGLFLRVTFILPNNILDMIFPALLLPTYGENFLFQEMIVKVPNFICILLLFILEHIWGLPAVPKFYYNL